MISGRLVFAHLKTSGAEPHGEAQWLPVLVGPAQRPDKLARRGILSFARIGRKVRAVRRRLASHIAAIRDSVTPGGASAARPVCRGGMADHDRVHLGAPRYQPRGSPPIQHVRPPLQIELDKCTVSQWLP